MEFNLYFKIKKEKIVELFKEFIKQGIDIPYLKISSEYPLYINQLVKLAKENSIPLGGDVQNPETFNEYVEFGYISSWIQDNMRKLNIPLYVPAGEINPEVMKQLKIISKVLGDVEFEIVDFHRLQEENPIVKGRWNFEYFMKEIFPELPGVNIK